MTLNEIREDNDGDDLEDEDLENLLLVKIQASINKSIIKIL